MKHHNHEEIQNKISKDSTLFKRTCTVTQLSERNYSNDFKNNWLLLDEQRPLFKQPEVEVPAYDKYVYDLECNLYN